jgi:hypothetical protein
MIIFIGRLLQVDLVVGLTSDEVPPGPCCETVTRSATHPSKSRTIKS